MPLDLDDTDKAALVALLKQTIATDSRILGLQPLFPDSYLQTRAIGLCEPAMACIY